MIDVVLKGVALLVATLSIVSFGVQNSIASPSSRDGDCQNNINSSCDQKVLNRKENKKDRIHPAFLNRKKIISREKKEIAPRGKQKDFRNTAPSDFLVGTSIEKRSSENINTELPLQSDN